MLTAFSTDHKRLLGILVEAGIHQGKRLFVVGGMVRDLLRGADLKDPDLDVVVEGDARDFARIVHLQLGGTLKEFPDFLSAKIINPSLDTAFEEVDFASTRTETYNKPGALPTIKLATIEDDLRRRDFTINSMAIELGDFLKIVSGETTPRAVAILDPYGGRSDLDDRLVRILHPRSFIDDPTRLFRGCRYVARIEGKFHSETIDALKTASSSGGLKTISRFRVLTEIRKIVLDIAAERAVITAHHHGLLEASLGLTNEASLVLFKALSRLVRHVDFTDADRRTTLFNQILSCVCGAKELESLSLGKKSIAAIVASIEACRSVPLQDLDNARLIIRAIVSPAEEPFIAGQLGD